jgi:uncharacterized lipoprotein YmbA
MRRIVITPFLVTVAAFLLLAACATTPGARFYTLNASPVEAAPKASNLSLALGPIDLPEYLERPQIVTRAGDNRLDVDEFNRWGGRLEEEIARVLVVHLGRRLGTDRVYSYPSRIGADTDYRLVLEFRRFDGVLGGEVVLEAAWSLVDDRNASVLETGQASYRRSLKGPDYADYAAALSALLARLGDDLAAALVETDPARASRRSAK